MNNMYDILAKINLLESKGSRPDFPDIDRDGDRTEPISKAAADKVDEQSPIASYKTTPGFDAAYRSPIGGAASNEVEELEDLMSKGALSGAEENRLRVLYRKYGINSPEDLQKLPAIKAQAMKDIRGQQELVGKDLEARNLQAAKEREAEMARMRAAAGIGKAKTRAELEKMPLPSWYAKEDLDESELEEKFDQPVKINPAEKGKYEGKTKSELLKQYRALKKSGPHKKGSEALGKMRELAFAIRAKSDWGKVDEAEVDEGNDFTKARLDAIHAGKPTFTVDGKTYKVTGDTSDEKRMDEGYVDFMDKKSQYRAIGAEVEGRSDDYVVTFRDGTRKRYQELDGRRRVTTLEPVDAPEEQDDEGNVVKRGRGRPKGSKRALGAKGPSGRSKLMRMEEDYDKDEYDEEGEMAKSQARTIEDAAQELQDILDDDENLPEWVQKKITLAKEYIDSARDYMKANPDEEDMEVDVEVDDEELVAEKAVSKAQRAAAGIAYAAKKGDIPKSELRGASKEMADMPEKELKKFAKTKEKGLPEKVKEEDKEEVDETTVAGSVATAPSTGKANGIFGKGVYESQIAENFDRKLAVLTEGMNINMSMDAEGGKSLTVSATDDDAVKLAQLLKLAGMEAADGYHSACPSCGADHGMCEHTQIEEELANSPDPVYADTDTMVNKLAGGLNGPKLQVNPNNMADNPLAMRDLGSRGASGQLNLGKMAEDIEKETESRLMDLYKRIQ